MNKKIPYALGVVCILITASLPRIIGLGAMITIDEPLWRDRSFEFIKAITAQNWSKTVPSIQPGVTTAWLGGLVSHHNSLRDSQIAVATASVVLILIASYAATLIWTPFTGWLIGMTLALDPFLIAHGRVIHTDSFLALFSLCSVLFILAAFRHTTPIKRYIIASAVFAGLAILTKIFAVAFVIIIFGYYIYETRRRATNIKTMAHLYALWLFVVLGTTCIVWPAFLTHPVRTVQNIIDGILLYTGEGREGEVTSRWWYYVRALVFRSTPAILAMGALWAHVLITKRKKLPREIALSALLLIAGVAYAILLTIKGEKSDRYILFTFLVIDTAAVVGYWYWIRHVFRTIQRPFFALLILLPFIWMGLQDYKIHPYYLAYYNPLYPIEVNHKLGWGEGLEQAAAWIASEDSTANVATFYPRVFSTFYTGTGSVESLSHIGERTKYVVLYRSMFERGDSAPETDILNEYLYSGKRTPVHVIIINSLPYVWIFEDPSYK